MLGVRKWRIIAPVLIAGALLGGVTSMSPGSLSTPGPPVPVVLSASVGGPYGPAPNGPLGSNTMPSSGSLSAGPVSPASPGIDRGQSVVLTADASGGTSPYSYQWYSGVFATCAGDSAVAGATQATYSPTPTVTAYYCYNVTDSSSPRQTAQSITDPVVVNSPLAAGAISPVSPVIDAGRSVTLTAHPANGTSPYAYQWYSGSSSTCSADTTPVGTNSATFLASPTSTTYYCYGVSDSSLGTPPVSATSGTEVVTVNVALEAGAVTPATPTIDSGRSVILTANPSNGTVPYTIHWFSGSSSSCSSDTTSVGTNSTTYVASPTSTTFYCYSVTDASANPPTVPSGTDQVKVNSVLAAEGISPGSPGIDVGQSVVLTANPFGGTPPYSYEWFVGAYSSCVEDSLIAGDTSDSITIAPGSSSFYCYNVTDSYVPKENATSATVLVTVDPSPTAGLPSPVSPEIDSGRSVTLTADPSGGTAPYHFQWYAGASTNCSNDTTEVGTDSPSYLASPTVDTDYCYQLTDSSLGAPARSALSATDEVQVYPALLVGTVTPGPSSVDLGQTLTLMADPSGGTPVVTVQWYSGLSPGCSFDDTVLDATSLAFVIAPTTSQFYCYGATDGSTNPPTILSSTVFVTVNAALSAGSITPGSPLVSSGSSVTLTANPSGGTSPYAFVWYRGLSSTCSSDTVIPGATNATYSASPTVNTYYCYTVTDASAGTPTGSATSGTVQVTVGPSSSGATFLGLPASEGYALVGGLVAAVVAIIAGLMFLRRRKKRGLRISQLM